jgi:hypothetical protein
VGKPREGREKDRSKKKQENGQFFLTLSSLALPSLFPFSSLKFIAQLNFILNSFIVGWST